MPIYEYQCEDCKKKFELLRPISQADKPVTCSSCCSENTHRVISKFFSSGTDNGGNNSCGSCHGGNCSCCGH